MNGKISRLMYRGYGFIATEEGDKDIFFHSSELVGIEFNDLSEGDAVTFELVESDKGPKATKVSRA